MPRRLLYENVGIGSIVFKVGECNAASRGEMAARVYLTQQVRDGERLFRDLGLAVGSRLVIIDFKVPRDIVSGRGAAEKIYDVERIRRLGEAVNRLAGAGLRCYSPPAATVYKGVNGGIPEANAFLGLIHAYLLTAPQRRAGGGGFYLARAAPATTAFIDLVTLSSALHGGSPRSSSSLPDELEMTVRGFTVAVDPMVRSALGVDPCWYLVTLCPTDQAMLSVCIAACRGSRTLLDAYGNEEKVSALAATPGCNIFKLEPDCCIQCGPPLPLKQDLEVELRFRNQDGAARRLAVTSISLSRMLMELVLGLRGCEIPNIDALERLAEMLAPGDNPGSPPSTPGNPGWHGEECRGGGEDECRGPTTMVLAYTPGRGFALYSFTSKGGGEGEGKTAVKHKKP